MKVNDVPSAPPTEKTKAAIVSAEAMKSAGIDYAETIAAGAAATAKIMERMTIMSLKRASRKPEKSVRLV